MAPHELDVAAELVCITGVAGRAPAQVRRRLPNREVEALDERGVQGLGILRRQQRGFQSIRRADLHAALDPDNTIVPPCLEHLTIDARRPKESRNRAEVVLEAIGGNQWTSHDSPPADDVVDDSAGVSIGAAAQDAPGPHAGGDLDGCKEPDNVALAADERAELIGLQLHEVETAQHPMIEALRSRRGPFEPARDRVAGMARDSGRRRNTHALDAQACDLIELPSRAAKPTVRSPRVRAERAPADCAAVPLPSAGLGRKRAVAHDVKARLSTVVTPGGSARHPIGRVHGSSVPAGETPRVPHDCRGAADRSTANGASTASRPAIGSPSRCSRWPGSSGTWSSS